MKKVETFHFQERCSGLSAELDRVGQHASQGSSFSNPLCEHKVRE